MCKIGRRYWREWCAGDKDPSVAKIVEEVLSLLPADDDRLKYLVRDSLVRRLPKKFKDNRDLILSRVTLEDDWDSRDTAVLVERAMNSLRSLGIPISEPRLRRPDK